MDSLDTPLDDLTKGELYRAKDACKAEINRLHQMDFASTRDTDIPIADAPEPGTDQRVARLMARVQEIDERLARMK